MAAPVGRDVGDGLEPMRDAMVDLLLVLVLRAARNQLLFPNPHANRKRN